MNDYWQTKKNSNIQNANFLKINEIIPESVENPQLDNNPLKSEDIEESKSQVAELQIKEIQLDENTGKNNQETNEENELSNDIDDRKEILNEEIKLCKEEELRNTIIVKENQSKPNNDNSGSQWEDNNFNKTLENVKQSDENVDNNKSDSQDIKTQNINNLGADDQQLFRSEVTKLSDTLDQGLTKRCGDNNFSEEIDKNQTDVLNDDTIEINSTVLNSNQNPKFIKNITNEEKKNEDAISVRSLFKLDNYK